MKTNNTNKQVNDPIFNEQDGLINDVSTFNGQNDYQAKKKRKKSRGNRQVQRYRRKLRKEGLSCDAIASLVGTWVSMDPRESIRTTASNAHETTTISMAQHSLAMNPTTIDDSSSQMSFGQSSLVKKHKINRQRNHNKKMTKRFNYSVYIKDTHSSILSTAMKNTMIATDNLIKLEDISNEVFYQMLSKAFGDISKLDNYFLNENGKIEFIRQYTSLIYRLSYVQLQQQQWDYYYHIGITHNIWRDRISKHMAEKNCLCYTYGRSKHMIQQRRIQIEKHLEEIHNTIQLFEKEILLKLQQHINCSSEIQILLSNINTFVHECQQKTRNEFEYKKQMLILDANDHHLVQNVFHLKPNKSQVRLNSIVLYFYC